MELIFGLIRFFRWLDRQQRASQARHPPPEGGVAYPLARPSVPIATQQAQSQARVAPMPVRQAPPRPIARPNNASIVDDAPVGALGNLFRLFEGRRD